MKSYDVWLTGTTTQSMERVQKKGDTKPRFEPVSTARTFLERNVAEDNENFRIEHFNEKWTTPQSIATVNGDLAMSFKYTSTLRSRPPKGIIEKRPDNLTSVLWGGPFYSTFYSNVQNDVTFPNAFSQRKIIRHVVDATKPEIYIIECPQDKNAAFFPEVGWRLTLDPLNGYLPSCLETYVIDMRTLNLRIEVLDYQALPVGIAVPTKVRNTAFANIDGEEHFGQPIGVTEVTCDSKKSRWNSELDPETFKVQFPPGTNIVDKTAQ